MRTRVLLTLITLTIVVCFGSIVGAGIDDGLIFITRLMKLRVILPLMQVRITMMQNLPVAQSGNRMTGKSVVL